MLEIKDIIPKLKVSNNIAIVGSSGRLKESPQGGAIDSFDDVVRFNRAPVEGWEELCGSKTTMRVTNTHVFVGKPLIRGDWKQLNTDFIKKQKNIKIIVYTYEKVFKRNPEEKVDPSVELFRLDPHKIRAIGQGMSINVGNHLTVGLSFIIACINSGIRPHLFGFDVEERVRDHYWEHRGDASFLHKPSAEKAVLKRLAEENKIQLHL